MGKERSGEREGRKGEIRRDVGMRYCDLRNLFECCSLVVCIQYVPHLLEPTLQITSQPTSVLCVLRAVCPRVRLSVLLPVSPATALEDPPTAALRQCLQSLAPANRLELSLDTMLAKPIQRVLQYPLYLHVVSKQMGADSMERRCLEGEGKRREGREGKGGEGEGKRGEGREGKGKGREGRREEEGDSTA